MHATTFSDRVDAIMQTLGIGQYDPILKQTLTVGLNDQQVADVVAKAGIHQSGVSRHLRILHESGFVSMRPDGQRRFYSLEPAPFRELDGWLGPYRQLWEARLNRFEAALEERGKHRRTKEGRGKA